MYDGAEADASKAKHGGDNSDDYLMARVLDVKRSDELRTPTSVSKAPRDRLLVNNAEFFDGDRMEPFFVLSIPRP